MNPERWQKIKSLFEAVQEVEPEKRSKFLEKACAGDVDLRREVEKLLASFDEADTSFMEKPAANEVASLILEKETVALSKTTGKAKNGSFVAGTVLEDRYRIIGLLGKGGMGEVYKAEDLKLDQTVALKFLPDKLEKNADALKRFVGEVKTARQVAHPNVCKVFDIGVSGARHFLSMEFIDGDDLSSLLRRIGRLPSDKAAEISRQICFGLHAIHEAGILHRDLKPANIIIDSNGKARITDFGIAGVEQEISNKQEIIGTPAYMSPEQITGREVTTRSDIYSLGLLLYEIFTGKQVFRADSINDLIEKHKSETPTNPSQFVENINPIVEKTINKCLEKNPSDRPASALQVALMMPGGNPLEAAIAAGETPSPEMVAAAPKKGALRPSVAMALLAIVFISFPLLMLMSKQSHLHRHVPLDKSPEILRERSRELAEKFGYASFDSYYGFTREFDYVDFLKENDKSATRWQKLAAGQPAVVQFWYRQSPLPLAPWSGGTVTFEDPSNDTSEMVRMRVDTKGRLTYFDGVPPQIDETNNTQTSFDWSEVFKEAGFNITDFQEIESQWTPPRAYDERKAWTGKYPEQPDIPIRVEAAAYRGKLVSFEIVEPWSKPDRQISAQTAPGLDAPGFILISIFFGILIVSAYLAVRNVRIGRSDLKGAFRVTLLLFATLMIQRLFSTHHVASGDEAILLISSLQSALFWACFAGMMYLALEPYLRRHMPERVISWNRLLAGDWRDPLVGRDILIGAAIGLGGLTTAALRHFIPVWLGDPPIEPFSMSNPGGAVLLGLRGFPVLFFSQISASVVQAFMVSFLLLFFTLLLRRKLLGTIAAWLMIFAFALAGDIAGGKPVSAMLYAVAFPTILVLTASRFGVLAVMSAIVSYHIVVFYPITTELSAWYAADFVLCMIFLAATATLAFYHSLAGQPIFEKGILESVE